MREHEGQAAELRGMLRSRISSASAHIAQEVEGGRSGEQGVHRIGRHAPGDAGQHERAPQREGETLQPRARS